MCDFNFINELKEIFPFKDENVRGSQFDLNQLAFLAVTSKCEFVIRDEIAFRLQKKYVSDEKSFSPMKYHVAREWKKRYDLAILWPSMEPICIMEFKAISNANSIDTHLKSVSNDIEKLLKDEEISQAQKYVALIVMLPDKKFDDKLETVVKYLPGINRQFDDGEKPRERKYFEEVWKPFLNQNGIEQINSHRLRIDAGLYGGVGIFLDLLIAGPSLIDAR